MNVRKQILAILVLAAAIGLGGCDSQPKGAGKAKAAAPQKMAASGTFRIVCPERIELAPGGERTLKVGIARDAGFTSEVKLSFRPSTPQAAQDVTFSPADWQLNSDQSQQTVTVKAAPAAAGDYVWTLIVRPRVGSEVTRMVTVVVGAKRDARATQPVGSSNRS